MKIYDCFTFFNELKLLELRLEELYNYVDYFVIVEADKTHAGIPKPFNFDEKKFEKFKDKIIYIPVKDFPKMNLIDCLFDKLDKSLKGKLRFITGNLVIGKWKLENFQRNCIKRGLSGAQEEDIVLISDLDEIPNPLKFKEMIKSIKTNEVILFKQKLFYYFLNGYVNSNWFGTRACTIQTLKNSFKFSPQNIRLQRMERIKKILRLYKKRKTHIILDGGWHFSHLGDGNLDKLIDKIISGPEGATCKSNLKNKEELLEKIKKGEDLFKRKGFKIQYIDKKNLPKVAQKIKYEKLIFKNEK